MSVYTAAMHVIVFPTGFVQAINAVHPWQIWEFLQGLKFENGKCISWCRFQAADGLFHWIQERAIRMEHLNVDHQLGQLLLYELVHRHILGNAFLHRFNVGLYCRRIPQIFHGSCHLSQNSTTSSLLVLLSVANNLNTTPSKCFSTVSDAWKCPVDVAVTPHW